MTPPDLAERFDQLTEKLYQLQYNAEQLIAENQRLKERIKELEKKKCST